jgi:Transposase DDE domain
VVATRATGTAEREATLTLLDRHRHGRRRITLGADKAYDVAAFIGELRQRKVTPHIAVNDAVSKLGRVRRTVLDGRTLRHAGYAASQRHRKRSEEVFGWIKAQAGFARPRSVASPGSTPPSR